ncbi:MAG: hypothetical protein OQK66_00150 [Prosthecochloris sp.]|uniref:Uncharacterized protein n=1 Tax=Prosthecochloris aestuarii (strain DSM 271 / SK 413) TaxID=290512 RepID=B4S6F1_PROA2|nr:MULTISPECIES: hypothetical protein [Prosthecochloris]ACF47253.1 conserved hypothetical protein [Prosthecochloris aestuarii DSM 271]MCW8797358.1 hypothetical protein [Prosthecochloris sp.]RDD31323.1 hypothetical protein CR161_11780 [Prosthecochloris sp. ZM]
MLSSLSKLSPDELKEIRQLENELGKTLLSYSSYDVVADNLTDDELVRVRQLEERLGTSLVVVRERGSKA